MFKIGLVRAGIIFACFRYLLGSETADLKQQRDEQSIELLCKLLHTVGYQLDLRPGKYKGQLEDLFVCLHELSSDKKLPPRARFAVQEVLELRRNGWHERRTEEGPKLVSEIRMMAAQEERQQHAGGRSQRFRNERGVSFSRDAREPQDARDTRPRREDARLEIGRQSERPTKIITKDTALKDSTTDVKSSSQGPPSHVPASEGTPSLESSIEKCEKTMRRVREMVDEYLSNQVMHDAVEIMEELEDASGPFVTYIIDRYLNSNRAKEKTLLEDLLDAMAPRFLVQKSSRIIQELLTFETLLALSETTLDVKEVTLSSLLFFARKLKYTQAPEIIGQILKRLVELGALTSNECSRLISELKASALGDEFSNKDQVHSAFDRLSATISS